MNRKIFLREFRSDLRAKTAIASFVEWQQYINSFSMYLLKRKSSCYASRLGFEHGNIVYCSPDSIKETFPKPPAREGYYFDEYMNNYNQTKEGLPF